MPVVVALPVKSFSDAKGRLGGVLGRSGRSSVGRALADRTLDVVLDAGGEPLVVAGDDEVAAWARSHQVPVIGAPPGLDAAARAALDWAGTRPCAVLHSDLPLLRSEDLGEPFAALASGRPVIAPSSDGGTSLLGGSRRFSYGPGSFHRHLAALRHVDPLVVVCAGLLLDLDGPADLAAALRHPRGSWLSEVVAR